MICGVVAASFITVTLLSDVTEWIYLHHQSSQLQTQVLQVYQQIFPGAAELLEPRFRVDALLKKYSDAAKGNAFVTLLRIAGETLLKSPHVDAQSVQYTDQTLVLTVSADTLALLNTWLSALHAQPVTVEQKITTEQGKVTAVIKMTGVST